MRKNAKYMAAATAISMCIAGCDYKGKAQEPEKITIGRYQFIGKEKYPDGSVEYSCLDTATGEISYAAVHTDPKKQGENDFNCAY